MLALFLAVSTAFAETPSLIGFYPHEVLRNEAVEFKPAQGHHFSAEAPQSCGSGEVSQKNPRGVKCLFSQAGITQAQLNVCDDAKTFCKTVQLSVNVIQGSNTQPVALAKNENANKGLKTKLINGWAEGPPKDISAKAALEKQPVFIMISTDWCPTCNEAKEYLLTTKSFTAATKDWFKVYVDGDSLSAKDWAKVVPFRFFPSFVLLNSKMEEVSRYTGPIRQGDFEAWANDQEKNLEDPISSLKIRVEERLAGNWLRKIRDLFSGVTGEKAKAQRTRLLKHALDSGDRDLVGKLLPAGEYPELKEQILKFKLAEIDRNESQWGANLSGEKIKLFVQLLDVTFKGDRWSEYLASLCGLDKEVCKPFVDKVPERLIFLSRKTGLFEAEKESQLGEEYYYITQIYQTLDDQAALKDFSARCTERFEAMGKGSLLNISRAGSQGMIACLELGGDFSKGEKTIDSLIAAYPTEPTFLLRKARMMRKQKKPDAALEWLNKAETFAFGYNWYSLQLLKGELYLDLKKPDQTRQVVEATLAQVRLESTRDSRAQSLVERLRGLQSRASQ